MNETEVLKEKLFVKYWYFNILIIKCNCHCVYFMYVMVKPARMQILHTCECVFCIVDVEDET